MRRSSQGGSTVAIIPVVLIGVMLILGTLQLAFFMLGAHAADLAAFRAERALEEGQTPESAAADARKFAELGSPYPLQSTSVRLSSRDGRARVDIRMDPMVDIPIVPDVQPWGTITVEGHAPPRFGGGRR